ncbi:hypothetical protein ALC57_07092 [Trachymyrmex cornetzi]|uniref:Uncharacterized protein n=1 Tax=Trachymyrmex cornetzi TaxID=471704 RepID=A0A195E6V7_9HYME|nr:hypothetical protein ALC57_07092 [Trachymyrmex cornetzi]
MGVVKTASESILEETVMPSEEANYSQQGYAANAPHDIWCRDIKVTLSFARSFLRFQTGSGIGIRITRNAVALKAMWRTAHPRPTANRCLEIQIYRLRCSRAPIPPRKSDLCRCNIRLSSTDLKSRFMGL